MHGGRINLLGTWSHWLVGRSTDGPGKGVNGAISIRAPGGAICHGDWVYEHDRFYGTNARG